MADIQRYAGVWSRSHLFEPKDTLIDTSTTVIWVQSPCGAFIDVRIPHADAWRSTDEAPASQHLHIQPQRRAKLVKSFAGAATFDASTSHLTWTRHIDNRLPGTPDVGLMLDLTTKMVATAGSSVPSPAGSASNATAPPSAVVAAAVPVTVPMVVQEDSVLPDDDYREIWARLDVPTGLSDVVDTDGAGDTNDDTSHDCAVQLAHASDPSRLGYYIRRGRWWALALARPSNAAAAAGVDQTTAMATDDDIRRYFDATGAGAFASSARQSDPSTAPATGDDGRVFALVQQYLGCIGTVALAARAASTAGAATAPPSPPPSSSAPPSSSSSEVEVYTVLHCTRSHSDEGVTHSGGLYALLGPPDGQWRVERVTHGSAPDWLAQGCSR